MSLALSAVESVRQHGFALVRAFSAEECTALAASIESALSQGEGGIRAGDGTLYAARNVLQAWPEAVHVWRVPALLEPVSELLGEDCGVVRGLYFDKPPGQSWALPWHKDLTIAVRDNRLPSSRFRKPTNKAGLPHVEAPLDVLQAMLTLRIHLDAADEENGALKVLPGSHHEGKELREGTPVLVRAESGEVLLMRPLLTHCSNRSQEGTTRHRRILHLELAGLRHLEDGYQWAQYL